MSDVPPEVLNEILSRLPVKSLLRFRTVSKPWRALIDSPYFVNLHLNQFRKTNKILTYFRDFNPSYSYYTLYLGSGARVVKLETPFDSVGFFPEIMGSCNGLICLSRGTFNREILLWNPSTKKYRLIQTILIQYSPGSKNTFTIDNVGYDHVNDDYKVVRLSQSSGSDSNLVDSKVIVYSLKLNSWQSIDEDFPYHVCRRRGHGAYCSERMSHGVCVGGSIHWVVTEKPIPDMNYLIAAFHLDRHRFQLVPLPEYSVKYMAIDLGILGGCLCLVGNHEMYCVDVWVMAKYGVKESWSKVVALTQSDVIIGLPCARPIIYLKNSKEVVLELEHKWLVWYDLEMKKAKHMKVRDVSCFAAVVYQESLV